MKKIRLAIVGTGSIAFTHMYGIQRLDEAELVAIMDIHQEQMDTFRKTFPVADEDCYTDLDALLAREDVDAVIVCASDKAHCDIAVRAMRAGKDVLCEKPMATTVEEAEEMKAAAEKLGAESVKHGDAGFRFELVDGYHMQILVWEGDDEFPPNAQVLYSDNFAEGFAAEDRVVAGDILITTIKANM